MADITKTLAENGALRQLKHNDGSEGFVFAYDKEVTDRYVAALVAEANRSAPLAIPAGYALAWLDRSYDQRVAAIIAFNQCAGDLDDKLGTAIAASIAESPSVRAVAPKAPPCIWSPHADHHESGGWDSGCGESWTFIDGGPADNRVRFCQGCGKPVEVRHVET